MTLRVRHGPGCGGYDGGTTAVADETQRAASKVWEWERKEGDLRSAIADKENQKQRYLKETQHARGTYVHKANAIVTRSGNATRRRPRWLEVRTCTRPMPLSPETGTLPEEDPGG